MLDKFYTICAYGIYACGIALLQALQKKYGIEERVVFLFITLLFFDSIVGLYKAYILHWDDANWFSSKKFITGMITKCIMFSGIWITIMVVYHVFWVSGSEDVKQFLVPLFLLVMLVGILHNILQISQKKELPELDLFSIIFRKVQEVLLMSVMKMLEPSSAPKKTDTPQQ